MHRRPAAAAAAAAGPVPAPEVNPVGSRPSSSDPGGAGPPHTPPTKPGLALRPPGGFKRDLLTPLLVLATVLLHLEKTVHTQLKSYLEKHGILEVYVNKRF